MLADILSATILFAVPLLLVALGGMFSERSGVINIALEGIMVVGALAGCLLLKYFDEIGFGVKSPQTATIIAVFFAGVIGIIFSMLLAFASIHLKANQTIGGTALNMLAPAAAIVITWHIQGQGNTNIIIPNWARISYEVLGITNTNTFFNILFFKSFFITTPLTVIIFILSYIFLYKTRLGLRLSACGEHPQAADSLGINVYKMRYLGVAISGFLAGIGGLAYTFAAGSGFLSTVAGYGFLALAVMIFGNWKPLNILGASLFFALFKIISAYASSIPFLPKFENIKSSEYIYLMLPYIVTMLVLVLTSKNSRAPKAEGIPYDKGKR
ncbi:MAG: ABC transporter permease [Christensenellaceae bacterium]|nr:ABC transporter permease [Christensenellaceae bacterium]